MAARLVGLPHWRFFTSTGAVAASYKVYFYEPGTTTAKDIYDDTDKGSTLTNPVTLNAAGEPPSDVYAEGFYDVVVKDDSGSTVRTFSNWHDDWSAVGTDLAENLLSNHSFETSGSGSEPFANWTATDTASHVARGTSSPIHGAAYLSFTDTEDSEDYVTSDAFPVNAGKDVLMEFSVKASNAGAQPKIDIEWLDKDQASITTATFYHDNVGLTPTSWTRKYGYQVSPHANARYAKLIVIGNSSSTERDVDFDDIRITQIPQGIPSIAPNIPFGLILSRDSGDTSHDINVTAGAVKASDFQTDMVLKTEMTKRMDATWAEGDDAGGRESGSSLPTEGLLAVWLIKNPTTGHVDVLGSLSFTSPTLPSGYTKSRLIGCWLTDSSNNLVPGVHRGMYFWWFNDVEDVADSSVTHNTFEDATVTVPPNCIWIGTGSVTIAASGTTDDDLYLKLRPNASGTSWDTDEFGSWIGFEQKADSDSQTITMQGTMIVDENSVFEYAFGTDSAASTDETIYIRTRGCIMLTRNDP